MCWICVTPQRVFGMMGYASWKDLSFAEAKVKASPYREALRESWARLKRAMPEQQSAAKPFVKPKWDETAYFGVQDDLYEGMDDGKLSINAGLSDLMVFAVIRATCSRSGALAKDEFDLSGALAKWSREGDNVLNVADLLLAREGFELKWPDGTIEVS